MTIPEQIAFLHQQINDLTAHILHVSTLNKSQMVRDNPGDLTEEIY